MQDLNAPDSTFLHRTDVLAVKLGINVQELPEKIGVSRRTLFAGRSDNTSVTAKTWHKLEQAERDAGIIQEPVEEPESIRVLRALSEFASPETVAKVRDLLLESAMEKLSGEANQFFGDAGALAAVAERAAGMVTDAETAEDLRILGASVAERCLTIERTYYALLHEVRNPSFLESDADEN